MRAIKNLFVLLIIVAMLAAGAVVALRVMRGKPSGVEEVKSGIVVVELDQLVRLRGQGRQEGDPVRRGRRSRRRADRRAAGLAPRRAAATSPTCSRPTATAITPPARRRWAR